MICGTDNCQSDFGWLNGGRLADCCIDDPDDDNGIVPTPSMNRCIDSNCKCTQEEVAAYIDSIGDICQSSTQSGCKIPSGAPFVVNGVPNQPCQDVVDEIEEEASPLSIFSKPEDKTNILEDIGNATRCLYYSYYVNDFGLACDRLAIDFQKRSCLNAFCKEEKSYFRTEEDTEFGVVTFGIDESGNEETSEKKYWRYVIPASKPSLQERLDGAESGQFAFDNLYTEADSTAANFVVDIFTQYLNCAVSKV